MDEACSATNILFSDRTCYTLDNSVLEMGHLSLVDLRSVEEWDRAFLRV